MELKDVVTLETVNFGIKFIMTTVILIKKNHTIKTTLQFPHI